MVVKEANKSLHFTANVSHQLPAGNYANEIYLPSGGDLLSMKISLHCNTQSAPVARYLQPR
jgi:hypothetical protein